MEKETSFIAIKPGAEQHEAEIQSKIEGGGLKLVRKVQVLMSEERFSQFYGHLIALNPRFYPKVREQMAGKEIIVLVFFGDNAVRVIRDIVGHEAFSANCVEGTLRHTFGNHDCRRQHENAVHRPKTQQEVEDQLRILGINL